MFLSVERSELETMLPPYVIGCTARDVTRGSRGI